MNHHGGNSTCTNKSSSNGHNNQYEEFHSTPWEHLKIVLPVFDLMADVTEMAAPPSPVHDQIARVLFQSKRGNALLAGNRGVGKTTALYQFASHIRQGRYPYLTNAKLVLMDVSNVGPEDSRACLESIFSAVSEREQGYRLVLCLDGISNLLKRSHGGSNKPLLLSLLSRSGIKLIGTMSHSDYIEQVGNDFQMLESFTRIEINEPHGSQLEQIVAEAAGRISAEFDIEIPRHVVDRIVPLTSTFLLNESQPAKSIDTLRQVCEGIQYDRTQENNEHGAVTSEELVSVISRRTGIPPETINGQGKICDFERTLADVVVGQDVAVRGVAAELRLISAGLTESNKPASVMMFAGMTGVGKTELAKRIAELYSSSRRLQVYSMGNFTEAHSVSGIIGVPPGYVGHEDGGRLINELRADPYSVFLLDEAEKCHPNVWKPFLNLFDEGWIVDQRGVKAFADRAIFILTTNAGDRNISQLVRSGKSVDEISQNVRQTLSRVRHERSSQPVFPPQFLSRMKRIIVFNPLDEDAMVSIAKGAAKRLAMRWKKLRSKAVVISDEIIFQIGQRGHSLNEQSNGQEGGRIIQKLFSDVVEDEVYRKSVEFHDCYESCCEIRVAPAVTPATGVLQADVLFV